MDDAGIDELLISLTSYVEKSGAYQKTKDGAVQSIISHFLNDYISNLGIPVSICTNYGVDHCHKLFEAGFDRVGFCFKKKAECEIYEKLKALTSQYGGQATFVIYEMTRSSLDNGEITPLIEKLENIGVGELMLKDTRSENRKLNEKLCNSVSALARNCEILIGFSGGIKCKDLENNKLNFSSILLGSDITFANEQVVLPSF